MQAILFENVQVSIGFEGEFSGVAALSLIVDDKKETGDQFKRLVVPSVAVAAALRLLNIVGKLDEHARKLQEIN